MWSYFVVFCSWIAFCRASMSDILLENCHISPMINSPSEIDVPLTTTNVSILFALDRFLYVDDVAQSVAVNGVLVVDWYVPCVANYTNASTVPGIGGETIPRQDPDRFWYPDIMHRNSLNNVGMQGDSFLKKLDISVPQGIFTLNIFGTFESYCDLDFRAFPFDTQTCKLQFVLNHFIEFAEIISAGFINNGATFLPPNANWGHVRNATSVSRFPTGVGGQLFSEGDFTITLQRKPDYYAVNLYAPILMLGLLELSSFLIPADTPDRPTFACTVMLSLFMMQDQVGANLPKTPQPIIASYYVLIMTTYSMICAIYSAAMCSYITKYPEKAEREILAIDNMAFGTAGAILLLINGFVVISYASVGA